MKVDNDWQRYVPALQYLNKVQDLTGHGAMHSKWYIINGIHEHKAIFWSFSGKSCQNWKLQLVHNISGKVYRWCLLTKLPRCKETCGIKCKLPWLPWVIIIQSNKIQVSWLHVHWFSVQKNTLKSPHQGNDFNLIEFDNCRKLWQFITIYCTCIWLTDRV